MNVHEDGVTITAPTIMWVKALDMLMGKLKSAGTDLASVAAISGAAQVSCISFMNFILYFN